MLALLSFYNFAYSQSIAEDTLVERASFHGEKLILEVNKLASNNKVVEAALLGASIDGNDTLARGLLNFTISTLSDSAVHLPELLKAIEKHERFFPFDTLANLSLIHI